MGRAWQYRVPCNPGPSVFLSALLSVDRGMDDSGGLLDVFENVGPDIRFATGAFHWAFRSYAHYS